jgi:hypothetical protein
VPPRVMVPLFVCLLAVAGEAAAREPTTAIAPLTTGQSAPGELQRVYASDLPRELAAHGFVLLPPNEVDMRIGERPELLQCRAGGCLAEVAAYLRVRRLALPRLDSAATAGELRAALRAMAQKLQGDLARPGRLEVHAKPGAHLTIDGQAKGYTPWSGDLAAGDHVIALDGDGARVERDVNVAPAQTARVEVELTPPPDHRHRLLGPLKWSALAVGVAGIAAGAALLALDGHGSCTTVGAQRQCPEVYDTVGAGAGLVGGGGALVAGAVVMFVLDRPRPLR